MKKLAILILVMVSGCSSFWIPEEARTNASNNATKSDIFVLQMKMGRTSREQDQKFIEAMRFAWHGQNFALNDVPLPPDVEAWFNNGGVAIINSGN